MHDKFTKPYNSKATEEGIYAKWEASGFFNPDNLPKRHKKPFTIIMPPPNANGHLHAGHALFITLEDIMTRYKRMRGYKALWVPGADHAGFETQIVYEKKLEKEGRSRFHMEPQAL
ncbi:MAG: class I tRNA ligase family protein, partial [Patescibacteria group bacterium]